MEYRTLTIAAGDNGDEAANIVDFGRPHAIIMISCPDTDGIATSTTMSAKMDQEAAGTERDVWFEDGSAVWVSGTLPATDNGTFRFWLRGATGARRVRAILSTNIEAAKPTVLDFWAFGALE